MSGKLIGLSQTRGEQKLDSVKCVSTETELPELAIPSTLTVLDLGINLVITASAYSASGQRTGKLIVHHLHGEYILISKDSEHSLEPRTYL